MRSKCPPQQTFNWQSGLLHEMSNRLGSEVNA